MVSLLYLYSCDCKRPVTFLMAMMTGLQCVIRIISDHAHLLIIIETSSCCNPEKEGHAIIENYTFYRFP